MIAVADGGRDGSLVVTLSNMPVPGRRRQKTDLRDAELLERLHIGKFNHKRADANAKEVHCRKEVLNPKPRLMVSQLVRVQPPSTSVQKP